MGETFTSLRSPSLVERVRQAIKAHIADSALKPGDPLPAETQMARELGVSRNAVREAVKSLEAAGLVEVQRGNGLFVGKFSFETLVANLPYGLMQADGAPLLELLDIRKVLEIAFIERVIEATTPARLEEIEMALGRMHRCALQGEPFADEDRQFHRALLTGVGNRTVLELLDVFWLAFDRAATHFSLHSKSPLATYEAHAAILEAVRARDVEGARRAMARHYDDITVRLAHSDFEHGGAAAKQGSDEA